MENKMTEEEFKKLQEEMVRKRMEEEELMKQHQITENNIQALHNNGLFRLELLKSQEKSQDILIDFGKQLLERLDSLNSKIDEVLKKNETK